MTAVLGNVTVDLRPPVREIDLPLVFRSVAEARRRFESELGEVEGPCVVRVYPRRSRLDERLHASVLGTPEWAAGVYDGRVRLFVGAADPPQPSALAVLVGHETCHLLVDRASGGRCPRWLDEGIAIRLTQELPERHARRLEDALREEKHLPLDLLAGPFEELPDEEWIVLAYAEAVSVTAYLWETMGPERLGRVLRRLRSVSLDAALAEHALSTWLIERSWLRWEGRRRGR